MSAVRCKKRPAMQQKQPPVNAGRWMNIQPFWGKSCCTQQWLDTHERASGKTKNKESRGREGLERNGRGPRVTPREGRAAALEPMSTTAACACDAVLATTRRDKSVRTCMHTRPLAPPPSQTPFSFAPSQKWLPVVARVPPHKHSCSAPA